MKTSEMIAMLEENPKLKFKRIESRGKFFVSVDKRGYFRQTAEYDEVAYESDLPAGLGFFGNIKYDVDDWELVREPVPLEEAMRAWANGKGIYVKKDGRVSSRYHKAGQPNIVISPSHVLTGEWYIDE